MELIIWRVNVVETEKALLYFLAKIVNGHIFCLNPILDGKTHIIITRNEIYSLSTPINRNKIQIE